MGYCDESATSRPSRARGLKLFDGFLFGKYLLSRPSRARGLKHEIGIASEVVDAVAPFAGAWIETRIGRSERT